MGKDDNTAPDMLEESLLAPIHLGSKNPPETLLAVNLAQKRASESRLCNEKPIMLTQFTAVGCSKAALSSAVDTYAAELSREEATHVADLYAALEAAGVNPICPFVNIGKLSIRSFSVMDECRDQLVSAGQWLPFSICTKFNCAKLHFRYKIFS